MAIIVHMVPAEFLAEALRQAPIDLKVRAAGDVVRVKAEEMPEVALRAISAGEGWPSDVRAVIRGVGPNWPDDLVAVASRFSPGAVRALLGAGANWADTAGEIRIVRRPYFIYGFANGSRSTAPLPPATTLRWSRSLIDIAEWLLQHPKAAVGVTATARATGWSPPLVTRAMKTLQRHGWLVAQGRGPTTKRTVSNPGSLLEAWSAGVAARPPRSRQAHTLMPSPSSFIHSTLPALLSGAPYALTGWAGASVLAPYAGAIPAVHVYVESLSLARLWQRWLDATNPPLRPVDAGANVVLLEADSHLFRHANARDGLEVASPARVYADLLPLGGRAVDAATHLRETVIVF